MTKTIPPAPCALALSDRTAPSDEGTLAEAVQAALEHFADIQRSLEARHRAQTGTQRQPWKGRFKASLVKRGTRNRAA